VSYAVWNPFDHEITGNKHFLTAVGKEDINLTVL
jgi:hypothetical protein